MYVYLIRHASAGQRQSGGRDIYRPLDRDGQARGNELPTLFSGRTIDQVISSPATRCCQTVAPLAADRGLEVIEHPDLLEGSRIDDALTLLERLQGDTVACSHADVIPELLDYLANNGTSVSGRGCEKGSVWILHRERDRWKTARHVSARATDLSFR